MKELEIFANIWNQKQVLFVGTQQSLISKSYILLNKKDFVMSCLDVLVEYAWTSIVTDGYLSLNAHYVDSSWVLQKRILNFSHFPPPHAGVAIAENLGELIKSWGTEKK